MAGDADVASHLSEIFDVRLSSKSGYVYAPVNVTPPPPPQPGHNGAFAGNFPLFDGAFCNFRSECLSNAPRCTGQVYIDWCINNLTRSTKLSKNGSCVQTHRSLFGRWMTTLRVLVSLTVQLSQILCYFPIYLL